MSDRFVSVDLIDPSPFAYLCPSDAENIERVRADLEAGERIQTPLHAILKDDGRWELLTGSRAAPSNSAFSPRTKAHPEMGPAMTVLHIHPQALVAALLRCDGHRLAFPALPTEHLALDHAKFRERTVHRAGCLDPVLQGSAEGASLAGRALQTSNQLVQTLLHFVESLGGVPDPLPGWPFVEELENAF